MRVFSENFFKILFLSWFGGQHYKKQKKTNPYVFWKNCGGRSHHPTALLIIIGRVDRSSVPWLLANTQSIIDL
ncbi:hypothetical protein CAEBREN_14043 [Caenorhabditis brenneri]|uniref:Uncharacterized protein n=1 Tax=Caenorhabditis brenneri TaxID=135651 RepID=G0MHX2_CAEBE|nr:hypothetical protein CAEBREN_14043 [Caenorhabditis brenneri]